MFIKLHMWLSLLLCLVGLVSSSCTPSKDFPSLGKVPNFNLIDHEGHALTEQHFKGKVSVVHFMFTSCSTVCPLLMQSVATLQRKLKKVHHQVQFVSISVDPDVDTPERLRNYAKQRHFNLDNWKLVTGDSLAIRQVVVQGFKQTMGERRPIEGGAGAYDILHGTHLVLVDRHGTLRGFYRTDPAELNSLQKDIKRLLE